MNSSIHPGTSGIIAADYVSTSSFLPQALEFPPFMYPSSNLVQLFALFPRLTLWCLTKSTAIIVQVTPKGFCDDQPGQAVGLACEDELIQNSDNFAQ